MQDWSSCLYCCLASISRKDPLNLTRNDTVCILSHIFFLPCPHIFHVFPPFSSIHFSFHLHRVFIKDTIAWLLPSVWESWTPTSSAERKKKQSRLSVNIAHIRNTYANLKKNTLFKRFTSTEDAQSVSLLFLNNCVFKNMSYNSCSSSSSHISTFLTMKGHC